MASKDFLLENKKENKVVIELAFQPISHYKTLPADAEKAPP